MNGMLTPMSKYYCSEMCNRVAYDSIQVLGGSGYMKDYAAERYCPRRAHHHDLRRHQPVAGRGGGARRHFRLPSTPGPPHEKKTYADPLLDELKQKLVDAKQRVAEAIKFVKTQGTAYLDLSGRRLVDSAIAVIIGHLLLGQGEADERKKRVARRFIDRELPVLRMNCEQILAGDTSPMDEYALLAGPVPAAD